MSRRAHQVVEAEWLLAAPSLMTQLFGIGRHAKKPSKQYKARKAGIQFRPRHIIVQRKYPPRARALNEYQKPRSDQSLTKLFAKIVVAWQVNTQLTVFDQMFAFR